MVIAGNNRKKTDYILKSVQAGLNVLADKPMAITPADFEKLQQAFAIAATNHVLLYGHHDRSDTKSTTLLQRALSQQPALFGELGKGSPDNPAIVMKSVHYFSSKWSPAFRSSWTRNGFLIRARKVKRIVDTSTHLVDLIQWEGVPRARWVAAVGCHRAECAPLEVTPITREQSQTK